MKMVKIVFLIMIVVGPVLIINALRENVDDPILVKQQIEQKRRKKMSDLEFEKMKSNARADENRVKARNVFEEKKMAIERKQKLNEAKISNKKMQVSEDYKEQKSRVNRQMSDDIEGLSKFEAMSSEMQSYK